MLITFVNQKQINMHYLLFLGLVEKVPWTVPEKEAIFKELMDAIIQETVPGKEHCQRCIANSNGALDNRDWRAVKYFVKNEIDRRKRRVHHH